MPPKVSGLARNGPLVLHSKATTFLVSHEQYQINFARKSYVRKNFKNIWKSRSQGLYSNLTDYKGDPGKEVLQNFRQLFQFSMLHHPQHSEL